MYQSCVPRGSAQVSCDYLVIGNDALAFCSRAISALTFGVNGSSGASLTNIWYAAIAPTESFAAELI